MCARGGAPHPVPSLSTTWAPHSSPGYGLSPRNNLVRRLRMLPVSATPLQDPLDGLTHMQPGSPQQRGERHDPMRKQPQHHARCAMSRQVVHYQEQAQTGQCAWERHARGEPFLPPLPLPPILLGRPRLFWLWERSKNGHQFFVYPGVQYRVGAAARALHPDCSGYRTTECHQCGGPVADIFVRQRARFRLDLPTAPNRGHRLKRPGLILAPRGSSQARSDGVRTLKQLLFAW